MSPRIQHKPGRFGKVLATVAVVTAVVGGGIGATHVGRNDAPPAAPSAAVANAWVDGNGGSCTYHATAAEYVDGEACSSFDAAWDAVSAGDQIRVVAGAYTDQVISGDKASETTITGEGDGTAVVVGDGGDGIGCPTSGWSALCASGAHLTLENITSEVSDPGPAGALKVQGANVTVRNFHAIGATGSHATLHCPDGPCPSSIGVEAANFTFDGGSIGSTSTPEIPTCDQPNVLPIWIQVGGGGALIKDVSVGRYTPLQGSANQGNCGQDGIPHLEDVRFESVSGVTFLNDRFNGPTDSGSGYFFTSSTVSNVTVVNSIFEDRGLGNSMVQCNGCTTSGFRWLYNTFLDPGGFLSGAGDQTFVGNFGYSPGCGTVANVKNVYAGSGSCGTNTYIGAASFGVDADGKLQAGSPAIDAAETPGASDECTGADVGSLDFEGTTRPQGSVCDAGADER